MEYMRIVAVRAGLGVDRDQVSNQRQGLTTRSGFYAFMSRPVKVARIGRTAGPILTDLKDAIKLKLPLFPCQRWSSIHSGSAGVTHRTFLH